MSVPRIQLLMRIFAMAFAIQASDNGMNVTYLHEY